MTSEPPPSWPSSGSAPASTPAPDEGTTVATSRGAPPADRLTALLQVVLCSDVPTQALLAYILTHLGLPALDAAGRLSATYVVVLSLADTVLLTTLVVVFILAGGERPRDVFLDGRPILREARLGLWLIPATLILSVTASVTIRELAPWLHNVPENPLEALIVSPRLTVLFVLVGIVAGGIREELQRAFILRRFEQSLGGGWLGLVVFSTAFGAGHAIQGWDAAIITGGLGALWGAVYLVRRSVVAPILSHAGFNVAEILGYVALVE